MRTAVSRHQRQWIVSALLIALFVRALIPAGFMPAMDRPLSFQICPDGYPAQLLRQAAHDAHAHHHHDTSEPSHSGPHTHGIASGEHCVFAAVAGVASFTFNAPFVFFTLETSARDIPYVSLALARERFLLPPSRGPPALS
jgi:hypothetical protein